MNPGDWKSTSELSHAELEVLDALEFDPGPMPVGLNSAAVEESDPLVIDEHDERVRQRVERFTDIWALLSVVFGLVGVVVFLAVSPAMSFASVVVVAGGAGYLLRRRAGNPPPSR